MKVGVKISEASMATSFSEVGGLHHRYERIA